MIRAILELLLTVFAIIVARAVLTGLMRGIANATLGTSKSAGQNASPGNSQGSRQSESSPKASELHRDPVCGTFVAETTARQRTISGQTFYYCSEACREKHSLVAR
jgi:hypothetical protein